MYCYFPAPDLTGGIAKISAAVFLFSWLFFSNNCRHPDQNLVQRPDFSFIASLLIFVKISSPSRIWIPLSDSLNSTTGISKEKLCMISISNIPLLKIFFMIWYDLLLWQSLRLLNIGSIALVATNKRFFISDAKSFQSLSFRTSIASCHPVAR